MVKTSTRTILEKICLATMLSVFFLCSVVAQAQKSDSVKITLKGKLPPTVSRTPQIKASIPIYRAPGSLATYSSITPSGKAAQAKPDKNLVVSKIYPNPVNDQVNIIIRLEKESNLSIKILDMLSNEVLTLANEKAAAGEQTKSFTLPKKLNTGIYFIRIIAGQESIIKRISVL